MPVLLATHRWRELLATQTDMLAAAIRACDALLATAVPIGAQR